MRFAGSILLSLVLLATATADRHVFFNRDNVPNEWTHSGSSSGDQVLKINIALKQRNLHVLEDLFWAVADPSNHKYGQFMQPAEILDIVAPPTEEHDQVVEWLKAYGIDTHHIKSNRDSILVKTSVSVLEKLFETKFHNFVNSKGRLIARQMGTYSIPEELSNIIQFVAGVSDFPMSRPKLKTHVDGTETDFYVVPETISTLYNINGLTASNESSQGVAEFQNDASYSSTDLSTFYTQTGISTTPVSHIVGPFSGTFPDTEATLDIQYLTAVGVDADNWYWTEENWMYEFANSFAVATSIPQVISMSWGWSEVAQCSIDTQCSTLGIDAETYVNRTNVEFQKIGLRGTTLLASAGDSGANGRTDYYCTDSQLHPVFPASSPYVTAVGATQLSNPVFNLQNPPTLCSSYSCASGGTEVAVSYALSSFTSGGGFSVYASRPSYQDTAVTGYLKSAVTLPPSSYFVSTGRGYPDVAALGHNFLCYISGEVSPVGGTSASSPTIAGIISLLNNWRLENGQKQIGFANTLLYKMWEDHPAAFNDVVSGDNKCTEYGCASTCQGFYAYKGWDPVSGLGSPNVAEIISYFKTLSQKKVIA